MWKMILSDGTELAGFQRNGNNYFREDKVDETALAGNLSTLTLTDGEEETVLHDAELVQQVRYEGVPGLEDGWYLCFREGPPQEMEAEALRETARIAFVCLAEAGQINNATAGKHADLFGTWAENADYQQGAIRSYGGALYRCVQAHTSQAGWEPDAAVSLWAKITDPAEEWPEWSAPAGAHDAYAAGSKVSHGGKHWTSSLSGNVWKPGVYGWKEIAGE